ncbi:NAD(P)/FAD-dependent oxidoreductase [Oceanicella sp. SM1341]|uniref:FAD-dependent oxidoreductase n=1 Tax=Oceanicella sp. SM1341 TaxID=1548889 RepID=UPI000E467D88|nr:NAD(P)/FAD-dependent oxidoreductase [Oceanicella sp. SM1341]
MALSAAIAGGGLGGLAAATALALRGWEVTVLERQPALRASGSGIYIWENGLKVLGALGAAEAVLAEPFRGLAFEQRDSTNAVIDPGPLPADKRLVTVPRSVLLGALRDAALAAGVTVRTGAEVTGASAHGKLALASGETVRADLVVGADGVWSMCRRALGLELSHEQTVEGALRTLVPGTQADLGEDGRDRYIENWNGTRRLLITPISRSEIYLALTCPGSDSAGRQIPVDIASWAASFPHWAHLIGRIGPEVSWGLYSTIRVKSWSAGRAALIGDAAHAQPPNLGQGGGMAMQNGLALACHLEGVRDARDIPAALAAWEAAERELVDHCQKWSCLYGEATFLPDAVRARVVAAAMADPWVQGQVARAANSTPTGTGPETDPPLAPARAEAETA